MDWRLTAHKAAAIPGPAFTGVVTALESPGEYEAGSDLLTDSNASQAWPLDCFSPTESLAVSGTSHYESSAEDDELRFSHWLALGDSLHLKHLRADQEARFKRAWAALVRSVTVDQTASRGTEPPPILNSSRDELSIHGSSQRAALSRQGSGAASSANVEFSMGWSERCLAHRNGFRRRSSRQGMRGQPKQVVSSLPVEDGFQVRPVAAPPAWEQQRINGASGSVESRAKASEHMDGESQQCVICMQSRACMAFVHGGTAHNCCCKGCVDAIALEKDWDGRCPMCRQRYSAIVRVFDP